MEVREAIKKRRGIREFYTTPVPKPALENNVREALWAPSCGNTQPWEFIVVGGKTLEKIVNKTGELLLQEAPSLHGQI